MPQDRFRKIMSNLHFCDKDNAQPDERLFKIRHVIDTCLQNFLKVNIPSQEICVDESQMKFHGRLLFKQYNPSKRARFGIKFYKFCQSTGPKTVTFETSKYTPARTMNLIYQQAQRLF